MRQFVTCWLTYQGANKVVLDCQLAALLRHTWISLHEVIRTENNQLYFGSDLDLYLYPGLLEIICVVTFHWIIP